MEEVRIGCTNTPVPALPTPPPLMEDEVDSNVMTLPTREATWPSSAAVAALGRPDNPVMEDAALGTVESSMFPTTVVAGGVLLVSAPKELSKFDMGSASIWLTAS